MPVLRNENVPAHHASTLVTHLLHVSEIVFPPLNAIGTVGNLAILAGVFAQKSQITPEISAKLPYIATSFVASIFVTVYALTVMVPINTTMKAMAQRLRKDESDKEAAATFRACQKKWQAFNMGMHFPDSAARISSLTYSCRSWLPHAHRGHRQRPLARRINAIARFFPMSAISSNSA